MVLDKIGLIWIYCKPKDIWEALKSSLLFNKNFSCEVKVLKINNAVEINKY